MTDIAAPPAAFEAAGSSRRRLTTWTLGVLGVTFLAGLLFGYDQGVISGALPILTDDLGLSTLQSEVITSWVTLGALVGALVAGSVADRAGRRRAAVVAGVLFTVCAVMEAAAPGANVLTMATRQLSARPRGRASGRDRRRASRRPPGPMSPSHTGAPEAARRAAAA